MFENAIQVLLNDFYGPAGLGLRFFEAGELNGRERLLFQITFVSANFGFAH